MIFNKNVIGHCTVKLFLFKLVVQIAVLFPHVFNSQCRESTGNSIRSVDESTVSRETKSLPTPIPSRHVPCTNPQDCLGNIEAQESSLVRSEIF